MNLSGAIIYLIGTLTDLYVTAIMLRLLLQWVRADFYNPVSQFLVKITNPVVVPARRVIPSIGRLDTASVVVMLLLEILQLDMVGPFSLQGSEERFNNGVIPAVSPSAHALHEAMSFGHFAEAITAVLDPSV